MFKSRSWFRSPMSCALGVHKWLVSAAVLSLVFAANANAAVLVGLIIDPATTAGAGSNSNRSGVGTWQLYAVDNQASGSFGISAFDVTLTSSANMAATNRAPQTNYIDSADDIFPAGFTLLRQTLGNNSPQVNLTGAQLTPPSANSSANVGVDYFPISGFGREASSFAAKYPSMVTFPPITGPSWGSYPDKPFAFGQNTFPVFLGEGTYTGTRPQISHANVVVYSDFSTTFQSVQPQGGTVIIGDCLGCTLPVVNNITIFNVDANNPGVVIHTFTQSTANFATWSGFQFDSYVPLPGGSGTGPANAATFDPLTRKFNWNSVGSSLGTYKWLVTASNQYGSDQGSLTVIVTIPEPAAIVLFAVACASLPVFRRRKA